MSEGRDRHGPVDVILKPQAHPEHDRKRLTHTIHDAYANRSKYKQEKFFPGFFKNGEDFHGRKISGLKTGKKKTGKRENPVARSFFGLLFFFPLPFF